MRITDFVSDDLWAEVAPLLPPQAAHPRGGRPWLSDRRALCGILFVLFTSTAWAKLPQELGCGSGVTCWRRLRDWQAAGVWEQLYQTRLARLGDLQALDWSQLAVDSQSLRAKKGGSSPVPARSIGANSARNGISWSRGTGCR